MKTILTDYKTGKKFTILHDSNMLPAFGEDGIQYFILTNLLFENMPRTDCTVLDLEHKIGIKPVKYPAFGVNEPMEFVFDKDSFDAAESLEEYVSILKRNKII